MSGFKYYHFDSEGKTARPWNIWSSHLFGAWPKLVGELAGEDGDEERYSNVEMFDADENCIEVVTCDGEPIGVIDEPNISKADLARFQTYEQIQMCEAAE
jgi:hypothetical protein